jgi:hypothetical protein
MGLRTTSTTLSNKIKLTYRMPLINKTTAKKPI